jgi:MYXO-CTERM domain-containing protein
MPTMVGAVGARCGAGLPLCSASGICAPYGDHSICTVACNPDLTGFCPSGMSCADVGGRFFCAPAHNNGCSAAPGAPSTGPFGLLVLVGAFLVFRRRRG